MLSPTCADSAEEMQHDWDELQTYTPYFLVWGLRSLLNSFGFYALAHTYRAQKPYGFQVHTFYVVVVIGLSFISERLMATSFRVFAPQSPRSLKILRPENR
ncbi:unnamed protein product [Durusdinium trenchii]|uniref:Uncharacterized protein n=1 Tax=Durusdinium trenchii TaxID=1381693 RepID=A0ABP0IJ09_9DINO